MSDEPPKPPTDADRFANMAKRIEHNTESVFGGAFVICVPGGQVDPLEALILDSKGDAAQFLMVLQAKIQAVLAELQDRERQRTPFGR